MIKMNKITKSYGNINVLDGFSYTFHKSGFVLLFGKSGCGKTTLLNILAGVVEYENGYICYENNVHRKTFSSNNIAYITQDISFIDFLTVKENLELASTDDALINDLLVKFNLLNIMRMCSNDCIHTVFLHQVYNFLLGSADLSIVFASPME